MNYNLIVLLVILTLTSCENSTEKKLLQVRNNTHLVEGNLIKGYDENTMRNFTPDGIEYGIIKLENAEKIKYWFESHHISNDQVGGTLVEMPNGELEFIEGYFCCEVQLPNEGKFKNSKIFLAEMKKLDGITP